MIWLAHPPSIHSHTFIKPQRKTVEGDYLINKTTLSDSEAEVMKVSNRYEKVSFELVKGLAEGMNIVADNVQEGRFQCTNCQALNLLKLLKLTLKSLKVMTNSA